MIDKKMQNAFSILELMVVMGITAVLFTLGIIGFRFYRNSVEQQNGYLNFITFVQQIQNDAKNAIMNIDLTQGSTGEIVDSLPDYYVLIIQDNDYTRIDCKDSDRDLILDRCTEVAFRKRNVFKDVLINTSCPGEYIGFQRRTQNIVRITESLQVDDSGTCTISIKHSGKSGEKRIEFDLQENTIHESGN